MTFFLSRRLFPFLLILFSVGLAAGVELYQVSGRDSAEECLRNSEKNIREYVRQMEAELQNLSEITDQELSNYFSGNSGHWKSKGISFYSIERKEIISWTDHEPVLDIRKISSLKQNGLLHLPNGWFYVLVKKSGARTFAGLLLLRHDYTYQNKYLKNEFNAGLELPARLSSDEQGEYALHGPQGEILFRISEKGREPLAAWSGLASLEFLAVLLMIFAIALLFRRMLIHSVWKAILFLAITFGLRFLMIYYQFPEELYKVGMFSPRIFASSFFFNSLGDLLINAIFFVAISWAIYSVSTVRERLSSGKGKLFCAVVLPGMIVAVHLLLRGLVLNSKISFDVAGFSSLEFYTALALAVMALLFMCIFLIAAALFRHFFHREIEVRHVVAGLVICSLYTAAVISVYHSRKEQETRKLLAQRVDVRRDHVAEFLFEEAGEKISGDTLLHRLLSHRTFDTEATKVYLANTYFKGYLSKFEFNLFGFDAEGSALDSNQTQVSLNYFKQQVRSRGVSTSSRLFYFIPNQTGRLTYLGLIPVKDDEAETIGMLVLTLDAKFFRSESGFPELFMTGMAPDNSDLQEYSIARYSEDELVYEYGNYSYSFSAAELGSVGQEIRFVKVRDYDHMVYPVPEASVIVISRPAGNYLTLLTLFSWVFAWFSILAVFSYLLYRLMARPREIFSFNLTRRIQAAVVFLVLLSFLLIGSGTVLYIFRKYDEDQARSIREQVNGLWFLLSNNFGFSHALSKSGNQQREEELNKLVNNLNLDFNLYNEKGILYYSSQPKIFEQQVVSDRMHPQALYAMKKQGRTQYLQPENIGQLQFLSAYAPFTDRDGKITAYLNLPYFEKQNQRDREVSGFLSALINIYVLLFALAVLLTLFISSRITKPLLLIQERLSGLRLGRRNEPIRYHRKDEIGQLVMEYNRMVDELAYSAERLAESERESAWREMAKQVAHEIKNPLTPMKLSVQHLQRAWQENRPDKEQILERMAKTLIGQIDTLSNIATEFSNFAKMPEARITQFDLGEIVEATIELFKDSPGIQFEYQPAETDCILSADRDQFMRALSNLVKNAIQAIPDDRKGLIKLSLSVPVPDSIHLLIEDNGIGIAEDQRDKIFKPNFTTKSSGMGLGLSLVKNIVDYSGGSISYTTSYGSGTSFLIRLPRFRKSS